jgi:hypothetical protein
VTVLARPLVMMQLWQKMLKVNPRESMEVLMLKLRAPRKTPKLALSLKQMRCEGVNFNALGLVL